MAIALDLDFRSPSAAGGPDTGSRAPSGNEAGKEAGEDFAAVLKRTREKETAEDLPAQQAETAIVPAGPPASVPAFAPALLADAEGEQPAPASLGPDLIAGIFTADLPGELETDRELSTEHAAEVQLGRPADASSAPASRLSAALQTAPDIAPAERAALAPALPETPQPLSEVTPLPSPAQSPARTETAAPSPSQISAAVEAVGITAPAAPIPGKAVSTDTPETADLQTGSAAAHDAGTPPAPAAARAGDAPAPDEAMPERSIASFAVVTEKSAAPDVPASVQTQTAPLTVAVAAPGPSSAALQTPAPLAMAPAHAVLVASPADVVDIVTRTASDGQSDRVVVQLDPPELGRVSIDFKFDAQGLQHVTITSETPEAMRQLRAMHSELVLALERQGLDGQNMTFQHQQQGSQQAANAAMLKHLQSGLTATSLTGDPTSASLAASGPIRADGRLDMRL